nr:putative retrotransposon Ty1-copia subclass protein [Tanacetum cinerariifolium]
MFVIEQPIPPAPTLDSAVIVLAKWNTIYDAYNEVACLMLESMTPKVHSQFKNYSPYEMLKELKSMFKKQARVERFDLIQTFHACKQEEDLIVGLILNGLTSDFSRFVRNYNMHNMGKTIGKLHVMLIEYEKGLPKKAETPQVIAIRGGKIWKTIRNRLKLKLKDYALESAICILNMVPTKKVDKTPYELWAIDLEEIQDKDTSPSEITSKIPMKVEEVEEHSLGDLNEPTSYKAAMLDPKSNKWLDAMNAEMQSMIDNKVWVLVDLPPNCTTVRSKWFFKKKTDMDGIIHTYKARLVVKGYTQLYGVHYEETFSPVADIRAIRILISIAAFYDYKIWKINVKTSSLNGYLDEDIYMRRHQVLDGICFCFEWRRGGLEKLQVKYYHNVCYKAEYIAASKAAMEAVWIRKFISGLGIVQTINKPIKMFCDISTSLLIANEPAVQKGVRHYHRRYHYVHECIELCEINLLKVHIDDNLVDPFTKALPKRKLTQHARSIRLC